MPATRHRPLFPTILALAMSVVALAATPSDYAVQVQATTQASPARATLTWLNVPGGTGYSVNRRTWNSPAGFTSVATGLPATASTWSDGAVSVGISYEYQVVRAAGANHGKDPTSYGYVAVGIGDGRFDQNEIPGKGRQLAVGRIDLARMSAFRPATETDLLRRYLVKAHAWRSGQWTVPTTCLVDDDTWKDLPGWGAPGVNGWLTTSTVGLGNVVQGDWMTLLPTTGFLFAEGCGWGSPGGSYYQASLGALATR